MSGGLSFISHYYCHVFFTLLARRGLGMLNLYIARSEPCQAPADHVRLVYISRHTFCSLILSGCSNSGAVSRGVGVRLIDCRMRSYTCS